MEWTDEGVILGVRRHGEGSVIVEAMTREHGRHLGIVRGGRSQEMRAVLQLGNSAQFTWRARLEDHLGNFAVQADRLRAATLMASPVALFGMQTLAGHLRLLPERDPHPGLLAAAMVILDHLDEPAKAARLLVRFELAMLDELGFGLDLTQCAATGTRQDLVYVSPRSGRAVSRDAGAPWAGKMLALPAFLSSEGRARETDTAEREIGVEIGQAFALTGYFLARHVWEPRAIAPPDQRSAFVTAIARAMTQSRESETP